MSRDYDEPPVPRRRPRPRTDDRDDYDDYPPKPKISGTMITGMVLMGLGLIIMMVFALKERSFNNHTVEVMIGCSVMLLGGMFYTSKK